MLTLFLPWSRAPPGRLERAEPALAMVPSGLFLEPGILSGEKRVRFSY